MSPLGVRVPRPSGPGRRIRLDLSANDLLTVIVALAAYEHDLRDVPEVGKMLVEVWTPAAEMLSLGSLSVDPDTVARLTRRLQDATEPTWASDPKAFVTMRERVVALRGPRRV